MKLVIDVSEELYKHIKNDNVYYLEDGEDLYTITKDDSKPLDIWYEGLIKKIETDMSWDMVDDWGNFTALHDELIEIIEEYCKKE